MIMYIVSAVLIAFLAMMTAAVIKARSIIDTKRAQVRRNGRRRLGFFHPYSTGGGGGERVLWTMIAGLQQEYKEDTVVLYTHWVSGNTLTQTELKGLVSKKFGITLKRDVEIVLLKGIKWVEASSWPRFTLILQSLGAVPLAWEALTSSPPDVFLDTMGYAFTYPLARYIGRCSVISYTHYPTVSTDMLEAVFSRRVAHNNSSAIASSRLLSGLKGLYYKLFASLYGFVGRCSHCTMVNSSWTGGHIERIWSPVPSTLHKVYPPCDCTQLWSNQVPKELRVISVAQFRPEKNHTLQVEAFAMLLKRLPKDLKEAVRLDLVGGVRGCEDEARVEKLKILIGELGLEGAVNIHVDLPYGDLKAYLGRSMIGLHTMWNEHFGIGIVEYMASGCIPLAHRSGGPLMDIVSPEAGFLAETAEEYAAAMEKVLTMDEKDRKEMAEASRERSMRFTEEVFTEAVGKAVRPVLG